MNRYLRWNDALAARFFNPDMAGRTVHLYVNQKLISDLERELEVEAGKFLDAMQEGPPWATRQGICQRALQAFENWRARRVAFPPYIAYLALFVLSGGTEGDFAPNDYHDRLRQTARLDGYGSVPSFNHMGELWVDLETWSVQDKQGELGLFHARHIGGHVHIGYPLAQTMLTEQERHMLPKIFYDAGLDPTFNPPADELARLLRHNGAGFFQPRTMKLLNTQYDPGMYAAMLATVSDELAEWDGQVPDTAGAGASIRLAFAGLRLCLDVDATAQKVSASLRCRLNREFPEDGIVLNIPGNPVRLLAEDYLSGWSTPLHNVATGETIDAAQFNWISGVFMKAESASWKVRLPGRQLRVFIDGASEGLPGLIEVQALPRGQPFFLSYSQASWPDIEKWATSDCIGFEEYPIHQGLPPGWKFARVTEAKSDESVKPTFPFMSFPASARLLLSGGIRSSRGNNYFAFARPDVILEGSPGGVIVSCNDQPLSPKADGLIFALPADLSSENRIKIEASVGHSVIARQSLFLTGDFAIRNPESPVSLDRFGSVVDAQVGATSFITGASIHGTVVEEAYPAELFEDIGIEIGNGTGYLIGQCPGQVLKWPAQSLPVKWSPVWAITKKRRWGMAIFVGNSVANDIPDTTIAGSHRNVRKWKEVIWHWRKRVRPPSLAPVRTLWKKYQEVARHV